MMRLGLIPISLAILAIEVFSRPSSLCYLVVTFDDLFLSDLLSAGSAHYNNLFNQSQDYYLLK